MTLLRRYVEKVFPIAKDFGAKVLVFGSGGARMLPQGFSRDTAMCQLISFLRLVNGYCEDFDISIAIEPLNRTESNMINSVMEGYWLAKYTDRPRIRVLADYYHMQCDNEPASELLVTKGNLIHAHIASKKHRYYPLYEAKAEHEPFFAALKELGYDAGVSVEGVTTNFDADIKESFALLDELRR